jgi:predicted nuclease with TOPRIM domain
MNVSVWKLKQAEDHLSELKSRLAEEAHINDRLRDDLRLAEDKIQQLEKRWSELQRRVFNLPPMGIHRRDLERWMDELGKETR